jgi:Right handed beta helix region
MYISGNSSFCNSRFSLNFEPFNTMKPRLWKKLTTILVVGLWPLNFIGVVQAAIPLPPILNVSTDLDQLPSPYNVANMIPNSPQDSAQLLNDAIRWVSYYNSENPSTPYTTITAEKGVYNFSYLTKFGGRYVYVVLQPNKNSVLQNVVIDLEGSDLFFSQPYNEAFAINDCQNLTLENFSIDYTTLPFTQLFVQGIVSSTAISVIPESALPGQTPWVPVPNLPQSEATLYGFDFHNGHPLYTAGRWTIKPTGSSTTVTFKQGDTSLIQLGDVFEVEARGGGPAISLGNSSGILLENLSIYSTGGIGIETEYSPGVSIRNVSIVPRPGTNRLVSTNAGGIAVNQTAANNTIENCLIEGTQDDSISGNSPALGYAEFSVLMGSNSLTLTQPTPLVKPGIKVYFVDPITMIAVRDPISLRKAVFKIENVASAGPNTNALVVTMKTPLPRDLPAYAMMYDVRRATRGDGLLIDYNTISSNTLARGIALSGQTCVTIRNNVIISTEEAGILCSSSYAPDPKAEGVYSTYGPMSDLKIESNELIDADSGSGPGLGLSELAAIQLVDGNLNNDPVTSPVFRNVIITDNQIFNTPRTGIWIMNVLGGLVKGNTLTNTGYNPTLAPHSHIPPGYGITGSQAMKDFETPVLIQTSTVIVGKNPVN